MNRFVQAMQARSAGLDAQRGVGRWATVESVDATRHLVKVMLQPEGILSGWVPVLSNTVGNGWGMVALPAQGQQVFVLPEYGDALHPVVIGAAYSTANRPPSVASAHAGAATPVQPGEAALVHASGTVIRLCADGTIYMKGGHLVLDMPVDVWGDVAIHGNMTTDNLSGSGGDVSDRHGSMDRLRGNHNLHTHGGIQTGGASTSATNSHTDPE